MHEDEAPLETSSVCVPGQVVAKGGASLLREPFSSGVESASITLICPPLAEQE